ncbi:hypothetical protein EPN83_00635 [Patescibacteria group bacterium]|nr:MAG: hypothetical protein EPN83_00635 [Patescibacteria group bacterium]
MNRDFSYRYYEHLLKEACRSRYPALMSEAESVLRNSPKSIFFRHDVDFDLGKALQMAEIENSQGVRATYFVMSNAPVYSLQDQGNLERIGKIHDLGHEIGLHFDSKTARDSGVQVSLLSNEIDDACRDLEAATDIPVHSFSFHRPWSGLGKELLIEGRINAHAQELSEEYCSDSRGMFRWGHPLDKFREAPDGRPIQFLTHPIWWADESKEPEDALEEYFLEKTKNFSPMEKLRFDKEMRSHVPNVIRRGFIEVLYEKHSSLQH